jgi:hypothetical protein
VLFLLLFALDLLSLQNILQVSHFIFGEEGVTLLDEPYVEEICRLKFFLKSLPLRKAFCLSSFQTVLYHQLGFLSAYNSAEGAGEPTDTLGKPLQSHLSKIKWL